MTVNLYHPGNPDSIFILLFGGFNINTVTSFYAFTYGCDTTENSIQHFPYSDMQGLHIFQDFTEYKWELLLKKELLTLVHL